jgi:hypothetical protein
VYHSQLATFARLEAQRWQLDTMLQSPQREIV